MDINFIDTNIGSHLPWKKTLYDTLIDCINKGMYTVQFFLGNPRSTKRSILSKHDIDNSIELLQYWDIKIFSHAPYIYNLAGKKDTLAWNGNSDVDNKLKTILNSLSYELGILSKVCGGVIIHPGNYTNRIDGLKAISTSINKINFTSNSLLLLENSAGQGTSLATTLDELREIIDGVIDKYQCYIGVCIDTAHLFGYGEYDIRNIQEIDRFFADFDEKIGLDRLKLFHLNDSKVVFGSKKDRHETIGDGFIWKDNINTMNYLLFRLKELNVPCVLETHPSDIKKFC
jgi:deoxyribonuclease IV